MKTQISKKLLYDVNQEQKITTLERQIYIDHFVSNSPAPPLPVSWSVEKKKKNGWISIKISKITPQWNEK